MQILMGFHLSHADSSVTLPASDSLIKKAPSKGDTAGFQAKASFKMGFQIALDLWKEGHAQRSEQKFLQQKPASLLDSIYLALFLSKIRNHESYGKTYNTFDTLLNSLHEKVKSISWQKELGKARLNNVMHRSLPRFIAKRELAKVIQQEVFPQDEVKAYLTLLSLNGTNLYNAEYLQHAQALIETGILNNDVDSVIISWGKQFPPHKTPDKLQIFLINSSLEAHHWKKALQRIQFCLRPQNFSLLDSLKPALFRKAAQAHYQLRQYKDALLYYQKAAKIGELSAGMARQMARCYSKMGQEKKAKQSYKKLVDRFPRHPHSPETLWFLGWEAESEKDYKHAIQFFKQADRFATKNRKAAWALFRIGFCYYKQKNYKLALEYFKKSQRDEISSRINCASAYWEGKILEKQNKLHAAREAYIKAIQYYSVDYYAHKSRIRLGTIGNAESDSLLKEMHLKESWKNWLTSHDIQYTEEWKKKLPEASITVAQLLSMGLDTLAYTTFLSWPYSVKKNPVFLFHFADLFSHHNMHREAYRIALLFANQFSASIWQNAPENALELLYPMPYKDLVYWNSTAKEIEPHFIFALMRQESAFDAKIRSWANAIGLMQIIPPTGKFLAKREGIEFTSAAILTNPETNVRLGTTYIRDLLAKYDNPIWVLTNYNAGPRPTLRWKKRLKNKEEDVLVEEISYWETRNYVKKVLGNFWTYQSLYQN